METPGESSVTSYWLPIITPPTIRLPTSLTAAATSLAQLGASLGRAHVCVCRQGAPILIVPSPIRVCVMCSLRVRTEASGSFTSSEVGGEGAGINSSLRLFTGSFQVLSEGNHVYLVVKSAKAVGLAKCCCEVGDGEGD